MEKEVINHPNHYANTCSLECIEAMEIIYGRRELFDYCKINAFKYIWRYKNKNGNEDLEKANWYCNKAIVLLDAMNEPTKDREIPESDYFKQKKQIQNLKRFINDRIKSEIIKEI